MSIVSKTILKSVLVESRAVDSLGNSLGLAQLSVSTDYLTLPAASPAGNMLTVAIMVQSIQRIGGTGFEELNFEVYDSDDLVTWTSATMGAAIPTPSPLSTPGTYQQDVPYPAPRPYVRLRVYLDDSSLAGAPFPTAAPYPLHGDFRIDGLISMSFWHQ